MARDRSEERRILGVFTTDTHLVVRTWDGFLTRLTGISAADALGHPIGRLLPGLDDRGLLARFRDVAANGTVEVLSPALHHGLLVSPPSESATLPHMRQRITIGPVREDGRITGVAVTIEDVTARAEREQVEDLARTLGDQNWHARRSAVRELTNTGSGIVDALVETLREQHHNFNVLSSVLDLLSTAEIDVVEPIIAFLSEDDVDLRIQAAVILGARRDRRAIPALMRALDDHDANVRFHAVEALGTLRAAEAAEKLLALAGGGDFFQAFPAVHALSLIGDPSAAPKLVPLLRNEWLRAVVTEALGVLGDELVVAPLVQVLNEPGCPAETCADALSGVWDRYERCYGAGDHIAQIARRHISPAGTQNLLDAAHHAPADRLRGIARVMGWLSGPAVQRALTRLLGQRAVRAQAVEALVRYGGGVVDLLIEQLGAEDLEIRQAAVVALGRIGDRKATRALVAALADPELQLPVAGALARLGDQDAFEALLGLLDHGDTAVRQAAIAALNSIGHPEMPAQVTVLLDDGNPVVRESAVKIAGYFGYARCAERVIACTRDASEPVRRAAVEHLPLFEHPGAVPALLHALAFDTAPVRAAAAAALARVESPDTIAPRMKALDDPDPWVRYYALRSIGGIRTEDMAAAARRLIDQDPAPQVRLAAIDVLGRLDAADAVNVLQPLLHSDQDDIARAAIRALGHITDSRAAAVLSEVLRSEDPLHRLEAVVAIGARGGTTAPDMLQWAAAAESDDSVADAAISALARVGSREGGEGTAAAAALVSLTAEPARREASVAALSALPAARIADVAKGLRHPSPDVRRATIQALSRMKNPEASYLVERALEDEAAEVRATAAAELRRLGSRSASRKLLALARTDPDIEVRRAAVMAVTQPSANPVPPDLRNEG
jgi:HEAT repeat protein